MLPLTALDPALTGFRLIINTVPALILHYERLKMLAPKTLVLDLASKPGGDAAEDTKEK